MRRKPETEKRFAMGVLRIAIAFALLLPFAAPLGAQSKFLETSKVGGHEAVELVCVDRADDINAYCTAIAEKATVNLFIEAFYNSGRWNADTYYGQQKSFEVARSYNEFHIKKVYPLYKEVIEKYRNYSFSFGNNDDPHENRQFENIVYDFKTKSYSITSIQYENSQLLSFIYSNLNLRQKDDDNSHLFFKTPWKIQVEPSVAESMKNANVSWRLVFKVDDVALAADKKKEIVAMKVFITPIAWKIRWEDEKSIPRCVMHNWKDDEGGETAAGAPEDAADLPYVFDDDERLIRFSDDESYRKARRVLERGLR